MPAMFLALRNRRETLSFSLQIKRRIMESFRRKESEGKLLPQVIEGRCLVKQLPGESPSLKYKEKMKVEDVERGL